MVRKAVKRLAKLILTIAMLAGHLVFRHSISAALYTGETEWVYIALAVLVEVVVAPWFAVSRWHFILRLTGVKERLATLWAITL